MISKAKPISFQIENNSMTKELIFIVDDEESSQALLRHHIEEEGFEVKTFNDGNSCLQHLDEDPSAICLDMLMPEMDGMETLRKIKGIKRSIPVIMVTNDGILDTAVEAMKIGAFDYIVKPIEPVRLATTLKKAIEQNSLLIKLNQMELELKKTFSYKNIIGADKEIKKVFAEIEKVKDSNISIFLNGESGTGKELAARAIHYSGEKQKGPFIDINCGAIPESLQESEIFGHERGAFTGAIESKKGKVELADGGTLFLDEVADMALSTQVKLLRFLQERTFTRVGGTKSLKVNVRVVSATNKDLAKEVKEGKFREDLYYRLVVYPITMPPLRNRKKDIPMLCSHFMKKYKDECKNKIETISPEAMKKLVAYSWPGNVRELENIIYRAMVCTEGNALDLSSLSPEIFGGVKSLTAIREIQEQTGEHDESSEVRKNNESTFSGFLSLDEAEKQALLSALKISGGNFLEAADKLGVSRATFYRKAKKHGINESNI